MGQCVTDDAAPVVHSIQIHPCQNFAAFAQQVLRDETWSMPRATAADICRRCADMRGRFFLDSRSRFREAPGFAERACPDLAREWPGLLLALVVACFALSCTRVLHRADLAFFDLASRSIHQIAPTRVLVVAIDDPTVAALGHLPVSPSVHARLLDRLTESGVAAVAIVPWGRAIGSASTADLMPLVAAVRRNGKVVIPIPEPHTRGDQLLVSASYGEAFAQVRQDSDGLYRSVQLWSGAQEGHAHLAALVLRAAGETVPDCSADDKANERVGGRGCVRYVPLGAAPSFDRVSYRDVLQGRIPASVLRGRVVLIGVTASGYDERLPTPLIDGTSLSVVEFLAEATNALATSTLVKPARFWQQLLFDLGVVPLLWIALYLLGPRWSLCVSAGLACMNLFAAWLGMRFGHVFLAPAAGAVTALVAWPLWAWRRQEALLSYLSRETARSLRESTLPEGSTRIRRFVDPIQHRLELMTSLVERVHRYRELVADWVDTLPEATLVADREGVVLLANAQVIALSTHSDDKDVKALPTGRQAADVLFEITASHRAVDFAQQALSLLDLQRAGRPWPVSAASVLSQGIEITSARDGRSLLIKCAPIRPGAGRSSALIFYVTDLSSIRRAERQRDMALRFMSHDMRAPQAAVLALVEQVRQDPPRLTQRQFVELVEHYATTALSLSDDFLFLARAESVAPNLSRVDPALALGDAVDDFWPQASAKSIDVNLIAEPGINTIADAQLLRRAFGNLIGNAIKYSPASSAIRVRLSVAGNHFKVSVVDQGIGIAELDRQRLFLEFGQLDTARPHSGHGLGLAFVKSVVDALGGSVFVRSTAGKGTVFTVRLPRFD
ncbi:CHASE2 domain-containing protein [Paraburkholderia tropica]|uniref:CHASE2 domain-containing protein n=1 Tax=Paraburkholderia tropica TaxID=92647 RepID=UPI001CC7D677|nr:CHASE2 domain-containing protein [Paraburkholderia tropica]